MLKILCKKWERNEKKNLKLVKKLKITNQLKFVWFFFIIIIKFINKKKLKHHF
jgi:hypothetical protein